MTAAQVIPQEGDSGSLEDLAWITGNKISEDVIYLRVGAHDGKIGDFPPSLPFGIHRSGVPFKVPRSDGNAFEEGRSIHI